MQLETNTIVEHILNVVWAMMRSVLVWGFILSRCLHIVAIVRLVAFVALVCRNVSLFL